MEMKLTKWVLWNKTSSLNTGIVLKRSQMPLFMENVQLFQTCRNDSERALLLSEGGGHLECSAYTCGGGT